LYHSTLGLRVIKKKEESYVEATIVNSTLKITQNGDLNGRVRRSLVVHRVSSSLLGPVVPSFRALSRRLKFTVRRHKVNEDSLILADKRGLAAE